MGGAYANESSVRHKGSIKGNMRVLASRDLLLTISVGLTGGLDSLYVKEVLGADAVVLGLLASIWSAIFLLFILTGGWISDQYDRKSMLLAGMILTLPNPLIFAFAPDWRIIIAANFLGAIGTALATPAYVALLFSSSEQNSRSRSIAVMNTLNSLANTVVPPLGALTIQSLGGLNEIRKIFLAQFILSIGVLVYTWKELENKPPVKKSQPKSPVEAIKEIFGQMGKIYKISNERKATSWLFLSLTGPWAWEVVGPFWIIYAAETCGSPISILGLLPAVYSLTAAILLLPLAEVSDRKGRKNIILFTRPFLYLCIGLLLLGGTLKEWAWASLIPLLAWVFRAVGDASGPSWTAASTEVIPEDLQSEWEATRDFLWRTMAIPATLVGGFLWNVDPRLPFMLPLLVDGLVRFPVLIYMIPETLIVHGHHQPSGPHIIVYGLHGSGRTFIARLIQKELLAEVVDETAIDEQDRKGFAVPIPFGNGKEKEIEEKVSEILAHKEKTVIIEGKPAVFAAKATDKGIVILLVAPKDERVRREHEKTHAPEFVVLSELEKEDREISKLTRHLYGVDISKLPPFDVAINTERVPPEKIVKIISLLHEKEESTGPDKN